VIETPGCLENVRVEGEVNSECKNPVTI